MFRALKRYKRRLSRKFDRRIQRRQFNFFCDERLAGLVKGAARHLELPYYPLSEHLLELGLKEVAYVIKDPCLKEELQRHILDEHLLVDHLDSLDLHTSRRLKGIRSAMSLFLSLEKYRGSETAVQIVSRILRELKGPDDEQPGGNTGDDESEFSVQNSEIDQTGQEQ